VVDLASGHIATRVLMERYDQSAADAAAMLVDWSLESDIPVLDVAAWLMGHASQGRMRRPTVT
jgi:hypothetical protein